MPDLQSLTSLLPDSLQKFSEISVDKQGKLAFEIKTEFLKANRGITKISLYQGGLLYLIEEYRLYTLMDYASFEEFLGDPDVSMSRGWAFTLKLIYGRLIARYEVPTERLEKIPISKLELISREVNEENLEEMLSMAESNSRSDMKLLLSGDSGKESGKDSGALHIPKGFYLLEPASQDAVSNSDPLERVDAEIYLNDDGQYLAKVV